MLPSSLASETITPSRWLATSTWCSTERTVRMSPGSFALEAGAEEEGDGFAGAADVVCGAEATGESPQPAAAIASAAVESQANRFIIILTSFTAALSILREHRPHLLPCPPEGERRSRYPTGYHPLPA